MVGTAVRQIVGGLAAPFWQLKTFFFVLSRLGHLLTCPVSGRTTIPVCKSSKKVPVCFFSRPFGQSVVLRHAKIRRCIDMCTRYHMLASLVSGSLFEL